MPNQKRKHALFIDSVVRPVIKIGGFCAAGACILYYRKEIKKENPEHIWQLPAYWYHQLCLGKNTAIQLVCIGVATLVLDQAASALESVYPNEPKPTADKRYFTSSSQKRIPPPKNPFALRLLTKSSAPNTK